MRQRAMPQLAVLPVAAPAVEIRIAPGLKAGAHGPAALHVHDLQHADALPVIGPLEGLLEFLGAVQEKPANDLAVIPDFDFLQAHVRGDPGQRAGCGSAPGRTALPHRSAPVAVPAQDLIRGPLEGLTFGRPYMWPYCRAAGKSASLAAATWVR